jgi:endo-1,4-beta-xylanase
MCKPCERIQIAKLGTTCHQGVSGVHHLPHQSLGLGFSRHNLPRMRAFSSLAAFAIPALAAPLDTSANPATVLIKRGEPVNYNQNYIAGGAGVNYSPNQGAGSFTVSYNTNADFVVGLGWQPGNADPITYSGSFTASGVGILSVYGWYTNPLVEYYIMETAIGYQKVGQHMGTVTSDGGTYDVYVHQQVNQPSIIGTTTFNQYISIRQSPRTSGTVTVANHFNAWKSFGMQLGTYNYQTISVESWSGSGQGSITLSKSAGDGDSGGSGSGGSGSGGSGSGGSGSGGSGSGSGGSGSGSGTAAQWGQCGGNGWSGPTTCASGLTCKFFNAYYSQCQ